MPNPLPARLTLNSWTGLACAILGAAGVTAAALPLRGTLHEANLVLVYLVMVVGVAATFGRAPGVFASIMAVLAFDFFFVPPYDTLDVHDPQYLVSFGVMLAIALVVSQLTARLRQQALEAIEREQRARALAELSRDLSGAQTLEQTSTLAARHLESIVHARALLLFPGPGAALAPHNPGIPMSYATAKIAQSIFERGGSGLTATAGMLFAPLCGPAGVRGVMVLAPVEGAAQLAQEQEQLVLACAAQVGLAAERIHFAEAAQHALVEMESERLRNSILSAISHDVRTPLAGIVGLASNLASNQQLDDEVRRELAVSIEDLALRMSGMVANLLDMARLHASGVKLNCQWQLLEEVIGASLSIEAAALQAHRVHVALPPELPLLWFDAILLERVFCNLLQNAARYAPVGSTVTIGAHAEGVRASIWVEDEGPGLTAGSETEIFEKFTRGANAPATGGVGLGLSICRAIVEAHGGSIGAANRDGGGARFTFTLPLREPPATEDN